MAGEGPTAPVSPFVAGLSCKCPRCGLGALFDGYLTVAARCEHCDLDLSKQDSGDGPAVFVIFILGIVVVPVMLIVEVKFEPPVWVHFVTWPIVVVGGQARLGRPPEQVLEIL